MSAQPEPVTPELTGDINRTGLDKASMYNRIRQDPDAIITPRTFIFAGKAAPGYQLAKLIIHLITGVADIVNRDPAMHGRTRIFAEPAVT